MLLSPTGRVEAIKLHGHIQALEQAAATLISENTVRIDALCDVLA